MGLLLGGDLLHSQVTLSCHLLIAHWIVLKDQQALEEGDACRQLAPGLYLDQGAVSVVMQLAHLLLQVGKPLLHRLLGGELHAGRQGVDEGTHHALDATDGRCPACQRHAKDEVLLAAIAT